MRRQPRGACSRSRSNWPATARQRSKPKRASWSSAWTDSAENARFARIWPLLFTQAGEPRKLQADQEAGCEAPSRCALNDLHASLQAVRDALAEQQAYRLNEAVLHCGVALLERYQALEGAKAADGFLRSGMAAVPPAATERTRRDHAVQARQPLPPCAAGRVPGHQPAAMADPARVVRCGSGGGIAAHRVRRGRPQAIHLPLPPRRCAPVRRGARIPASNISRRTSCTTTTPAAMRLPCWMR